MKKNIAILLILFLLSHCTITKTDKGNSTLEGQIWTFGRELSGSGVGWGDSWTFLPNNKFIRKNWYSGGAYWTNNFSGSYFYDEKSKTAFLKYDRSRTKVLKKQPSKQQLYLTITENDTILTITDHWGKQKSASENTEAKTTFPNVINEKSKFKIEHKKLGNLK